MVLYHLGCVSLKALLLPDLFFQKHNPSFFAMYFECKQLLLDLVHLETFIDSACCSFSDSCTQIQCSSRVMIFCTFFETMPLRFLSISFHQSILVSFQIFQIFFAIQREKDSWRAKQLWNILYMLVDLTPKVTLIPQYAACRCCFVSLYPNAFPIYWYQVSKFLHREPYRYFIGLEVKAHKHFNFL